MKMIRVLEHLRYDDRLREWSLFNLEKAPGRPSSSIPVPKGDLQEKRGGTLYQGV